MNKEYNYGLAILRIVLCFEVVMCHFFYETTMKTILLLPFSKLRSFAAPTFFFLSFYLVANRLAEARGEYLRRRIQRILVPFTIWNVLYWILLNVLSRTLGIGDSYGANALILQVILGHLYNPPMWFMWDMAVVTIIFFLCDALEKKMKYYGELALLFITIFSIFLQYTRISFAVFGGLDSAVSYPLGRVFEMIPLAYIAHVLARYGKGLIDNKICVVIISIIGIMLVYILRGQAYIVESFGYAGVVTIIIAFLQVLIMSELSFKWLPESVKKGIRLFARYSMGIYCMHFFVGTVVIFVCQRNGLETYNFTGCVVIFVICLAMCIIIDKLFDSRFIKMLIQ